MRALRTKVFALTVAVVAMLGGASQVALAQSGELVYGVTSSNRLIGFNSNAPSNILGSVAISNLIAGDRVVALDMRPATNQLYAIGTASQLYLIDQRTGAATRIGRPLSPPLSGTEFGFDFNPAVDRIRIVSNTGQNLRVHPDTAVVTVDGNLAYRAGDPNAGRMPNIVAAAYTNPDNDASTSTTLFDIDAALAIGVTQAPPNDGTLNTFGPLGSATMSQVGFDISLTDVLVSLNQQGSSTSSLVSFAGGQRRELGTIGGGDVVPSIAISLGVPFTPPAERVYGVANNGDLISFSADAPGSLLSRVAVTNLNAGERLVGIDFRPANNRLYALGSSSQLYLLEPRTGAASRVGAPLTTALVGVEFGFDFNPVPDRIRVVSDAGQNLRLHPDTGGVAFVDGNLAYAPGDTNAGRQPRVTGAAYTNPDTDTTTGTVLFVFDSGLDIGAIQDPPNAGTLNTFAGLGMDAGDVVGFDISLSQALIAFVPAGGTQTRIFDVANGRRRDLGLIGNGEGIRGLAISLR
ncbi:MAG TPA: DUF4394 domain-containing protein [Vicinamibacterales bacterium]|nr:DUF4394 domain-containing protein [Vicinamibacterales bacterium]